jgi:hypothetical protein
MVTEHRRFPQYLEQLSLRITRLGMQLGQPSAPAPFESFSWVYLVIGAGFVSFALVALMGRLPLAVLLGCGVGGVSALVLVGMWDVELARQALALLIAAVVPWLLLWVSTERFSGWKLVVIVSLCSIVAGLAAAAVLSDLSYFLKINEFSRGEACAGRALGAHRDGGAAAMARAERSNSRGSQGLAHPRLGLGCSFSY